MLRIDWRQSQVDVDTFLRDYWQQKPLFIKGGLAHFAPLLEADELAGLACEDEVESRLITEKSDPPWHLQRGPFQEKDFASLPKSHWTLLVQSVDVYDDSVAELLEAFTFIPQWRLDDVMVSFAVPGGSVGPHFDQYDVFLVQGEGRREWRLGQNCDHTSPRIDGTELHILSEFEEHESFICEQGDVLYIPPGVAHHGVALEDCLTYSVGFRAPSLAEVLDQFAFAAGEASTNSQRFSDGGRPYNSHSAAIANSDINTLRQMIVNQLDNDASIAAWFGRFMTECKHPVDALQEPLIAREIPELLQEHQLTYAPGARFAYFLSEQGMQLFANGEALEILAAHADHFRALADKKQNALQALQQSPHVKEHEYIAQLINAGALTLE